MVQTYRFFQTAAYRREKLRVAERAGRLQRPAAPDPAARGSRPTRCSAADVVLAEVENQATRQQVEVARAGLRQRPDRPAQPDRHPRDGRRRPSRWASSSCPGTSPPIEEQALVQMALQSRPDIHAARAAVDGAVRRRQAGQGATASRPRSSARSTQIDEAGIQYIGFVYITPAPDPEQRQAPGPPARGRVPPGAWSTSSRPSSGPSPRSGPPSPSGTPPTGCVTGPPA